MTDQTRLLALNPPTVPTPASRYAQAIVHPAGWRRVVVSGQIGARADGTLAEGMDAQLAQAFANFVAVLAAAGFKPSDTVKLTVYVTDASPETTARYRAHRDAAMAGHTPASTYLVVPALAHPGFLCEVEGEAVAP
jgi:enamine deaminase RidA (YjgF/YER057c/UK114 family)